MTPKSEGPSLDLPRLIEVLNRHEVEYLLVGSVAATAYGAERETDDADCVVRRERANLEQLAGVMLENAGNSTWTTDAGPFDVLADLKDSTGRSVPYEELITRSTVLRGDGFVLHVASLDDVIAAKTFANREKDREALPELLGPQRRPGIGKDQATQLSSETEIPGPTLELYGPRRCVPVHLENEAPGLALKAA
jgi:predicted nucleotidyltransferase